MGYDAWMENFIVGLFESHAFIAAYNINFSISNLWKLFVYYIYNFKATLVLKGPRINEWTERIKTSRVKQENIRNMKLTYKPINELKSVIIHTIEPLLIFGHVVI